ncbi:MAG TPA: FAD-dependent monooxygenase [Gammaproteobacteria bacterium]|nr:FAD-dependent monooxygenase [Gammaproteobacteria bacterium]
MRYDALVIGAGPAGSTAANRLAAAGWSVAIVEKSAFPRQKVCGEFVSASVAELLHALGAGDAYESSAGPEVRRVGLFARDGAVVAPMPRVEGGRRAYGRAVGRDRLDTLLLECAARRGAKLWQPYRAADLRADGGEYVCTIESKGGLASKRDTRRLRARIVVAAHGSYETGPLPTQHARPRARSDLLAFKARFEDARLASDLMPLLAFPGGYGGLVHTDAGRASLSCCIRRDALEACRRARAGRAGEAVLEHILGACVPARDALAHAKLEGAWLAAGPIAPGIRAFRADAERTGGGLGGIFAVGNAAGEAHPVIAEGISMAIQGADLLAGLLVASQDRIGSPAARAEVGRRYAAAWRGRFGARLRAAALFARLASSEHAAGLLLPLARALPGAISLGARWSGKAQRAGASA